MVTTATVSVKLIHSKVCVWIAENKVDTSE